jgi:hypothetical protein
MEITILNLRWNNNKHNFMIVVLFEEFNKRRVYCAVYFEHHIIHKFNKPKTLIELSSPCHEN